MRASVERYRVVRLIRLALVFGVVAMVLTACGDDERIGSASGENQSFESASTSPATARETSPTVTETATDAEPSPTVVATVKQSEDEARRHDAELFAEAWGISLEEALERLEQADDVGELGAILEASEPETFAGAYLQHEPEYRYVVLFTRDAEETIWPYIEGTEFENFVVAREVRFSYAELREAQAEAGRMLSQIDANLTSGISVMENRVEVYVFDGDTVDALLAEAGLALPEPVIYIEGGSGEVPPDYNPTPVPGVYFAQLKPQLGPHVQMEALLVGKLVLMDGCLQIESGRESSPEYTIPIWPADHQLRVEGESIEVLNAGGQVVARAGERVNMGGGSGLQDPEKWSEHLRDPLPDECNGPFWTVGGTYPLGTGPGSS